MIVGGHETSPTALTWFWYELNQHPDVEKKVLEEKIRQSASYCITVSAYCHCRKDTVQLRPRLNLKLRLEFRTLPGI